MHIHQRPYVFLIKILLSILIVSTVSLPASIVVLSPFWGLLFFTYWFVTFTTKEKMFVALLLGILIDVLHGALLGQNALALILSMAFITKIKQSFVVSNLTTQQVYIFAAASIYLCVLLLVHSISIQSITFDYYLLFTPLTSALFWPLVHLFLSKLKQ